MTSLKQYFNEQVVVYDMISRKPAGRHLARVRFANEMRKGGVGGEAGETAEKSRHSSVNWVGAGVLWPGEVPGGNSVTVGYQFPLVRLWGKVMRRIFCGGKSKNMVNTVVVKCGEGKTGCWKVSKTSQISCFGS